MQLTVYWVVEKKKGYGKMRKKLFRRVVSITMAGLMAFTASFSDFSGTLMAKADTNAQPGDLSAATDYGLVDNVQDGVILHCWNWSYSNISANMEAIAEAGYSAVQTSPIQAAKEGTTGKSVGTNWWVYYQPAGFWIDNSGNSALGNKAEFKAMCDKAEQYGIKVIVDVVANHVGNKTGNNFADTVDPEIKNDASMVHTVTENSNYSTRYENTQKCICNCPDLNTGNSKIQNKVLSFLKECIDAGADGFRFDAAKHIETAEETGGFASQFWPTVVNGAKSYYKEKTSGNLYCYGEILDNLASSGSSPSITAYTKYISVTANGSSNAVMQSVGNSNASGAASSNISVADKSSTAVLWAESHDTWANDDGYLSRGYSTDKVQRAWAMIGSRADAAGLYFARPTRNAISNGTKISSSSDATSVKLGDGKDTGWKDKQVAAVNHFHNYFVGAKEYLGSSDGVAYNVRYSDTEGKYGVVLCSVSGGSKTLSGFSVPKMADGTYTDEVTDTTFTVSGGKITGKIGDTGIAVVYSAKVSPIATISQAGGKFRTESLSITFGLKNATSGTYKIGSSAAVTYSKDTTIEIGKELKAGESVTITLNATDGKTTSADKSYTFTKADPTQVYTAYCKKPSGWTGDLYCYAYDGAVNNAAWPGEKMTKGSDGIYYYQIPDDIEEPNVIFYAGSNSMRYPADEQPGLVMTSLSMIYDGSSWKEYATDNGTVTVKYVDENGKEIASSDTLTGKVGSAYTTSAKTVSGYTLSETPSNAAGTYSKTAVTVTYKYKKSGSTETTTVVSSQNVLYVEKPSGWSKLTAYVYDDTTSSTTVKNAAWPGVELSKDSATGYYKYDIPENIKAPKVIISDNGANQIPGAQQPGLSVNGTMLFKDGKVQTYTPPVTTGTVVVKYVDKDGKELKASEQKTGKVGDAYTTEAAAIENYKLVKTPSNATGKYTAETITVEYVYEVIPDDKIRVEASLESGATFDTETKRVTLKLVNATSGTYSLDGGPAVEFTDEVEVLMGQGKIADSKITIDVTAKNEKEVVKQTFTYNKKFNGKVVDESMYKTNELSGASAADNSFASKYYSTSGSGSNKTIKSAADWTPADMIAQGVANDDSNVFRGPHEYPVYDEYSLYGAYDDENLYIGWQYVDVRDVTAKDQQGAGTTEAKPDNADIPQMIALDLGASKGKYTDGVMADGKCVWGIDVTYKTNVNALLCFSSKVGVGQPSLFTTDSTGKFTYDSENCIGFKKAGISFTREDGLFAGIDKLYGINKNGYTGLKTDMLFSNDSAWEDLLPGHNTKLDTFYTMTIPYSALGIDKSYVQKNGIGVMHISTYGASGVASIPADASMYDVAAEEYSKDTSTTHEKEDMDVVTAKLARIGNGTPQPTTPEVTTPEVTTPEVTTPEETTPITGKELTVNFGADRSAPQLDTTQLKLEAIASGGKAPYKYEFVVNDKVVQASSDKSTYMWNASQRFNVIKVNVTDANGDKISCAKYYTAIQTYHYEEPEMTEFKADSTGVYVGEKVGLTAAAKGGEGTLQYRFEAKDAAGNVTVIKDYSDAKTATWTTSKEGVYTLTATVKDDKGTTDSREIASFTVNKKDVPVITINAFTTNAKSIKAGQSLTLTAEAVGGEGTLKYTFKAENAAGDVTIIKSSTTASEVVWTPSEVGTYKLTVTVKDVNDTVAEATINGFEVTQEVIDDELTADTFKVSIQSEKAEVGDKIKLSGKASGGEGDLLYKFVYVYDDEATVIKDYSSKKSVYWTPKESGVYKLYMYVTDDTGVEVCKTIKKYIVNNKPLAMTSFKANNLNAINLGKSVNLKAATRGGEGTIKYKFTYKSVTASKATVIRGYKKTASVKWTPASSGIYKVTAYAKDEDGSVVKKSFYFVVL